MVQNKSGHASRRRPSKWTAIDAVFLLLAVVVVIGAAVRAVDFLLPDNQTSPQFCVYFTAETYHTMPQQIGEQDDIYLHQSGTANVRLGYIRAADVQSSRPDDRQNVVLTGFFVVDNGRMTDDGNLVIGKSDKTLAVGTDVKVCTDRAVLQIHIDSIEEYVVESDTTVAEEPDASTTSEEIPDNEPDVIPNEDEDRTPAEEEESSTEPDESAEVEETQEEKDSSSDTE